MQDARTGEAPATWPKVTPQLKLSKGYSTVNIYWATLSRHEVPVHMASQPILISSKLHAGSRNVPGLKADKPISPVKQHAPGRSTASAATARSQFARAELDSGSVQLYARPVDSAKHSRRYPKPKPQISWEPVLCKDKWGSSLATCTTRLKASGAKGM